MVNGLLTLLRRIIERILKNDIGDERWKTLVQFIGFGFVGASNTLISYAVYAVLVKCGVHYIAASVIGFVISVLNSFFWNNRYIFKIPQGKKRPLLPSFIKTFLSYSATGLLLANALLYLWVDVLDISEYLAPIINLLITIPLNFLLNKLWAFKNK